MSEIRPRGKSVLTSMGTIAGMGLSAISGTRGMAAVIDGIKRPLARGSQHIGHKRPKDGSWAHPKLHRRSKYMPHQGTQEIERRFINYNRYDPIYFHQQEGPDVMGSVNPLAKPLKGTVDCLE